MSGGKKQIPLRISEKLYEQLSAWAQDEFRSLNGQIEFLLSAALKKRQGKAGGQSNGDETPGSSST
ncbi:MAG: hypothetical protein QM308_04675 [Bacillota bacterium]|nr:hypothetical protein [Bacillota bacterium]